MPAKVFISYLAYSGHPLFMSDESVRKVMARAGAAGVQCLRWTRVGESLISRARNAATAAFMASDCTHFLSLDDDMIFHDEDLVLRLLKLASPMAGGLYVNRHGSNVTTVFEPPLTSKDIQGHYARAEPMPARWPGGGCFMVERAVVAAMQRHHPELEYDGDGADAGTTLWAFWSPYICRLDIPGHGKRRKYLSDDWAFAERARTALDALEEGAKWWEGAVCLMDPTLKIDHLGDTAYRGPWFETT